MQTYTEFERADIDEALDYAAWRMEDREDTLALS